MSLETKTHREDIAENYNETYSPTKILREYITENQRSPLLELS
jgi:hypothetical protein